MYNTKNNDIISEHTEAQYLLQNYLKLLYSPSFSTNYQKLSDNKVNHLLHNVNIEHLKFEQGARQRNLFKFFQTATPLFTNFFSEEVLRKAVAGYCDSDDFWQFRGRNIVENFCLYFHNYLVRDKNNFGADITKLYGIISGLSHTMDLNSPWQGSLVSYDPYSFIWKEKFHSLFQLIQTNGEIQSQLAISSHEEIVEYEIEVIIKDKSSIEIHCTEVVNIHEH